MILPLGILTVVRNDRAGLERTWDSLQAQTWQGFEWVVVDGASADGTTDWLRSHRGRRTAWISAPDRGVYHAMNRALDLSRADALLFLNAGDTLAGSDTAGRIAAVLNTAPTADFLYGDSWQRREDGPPWLKTARSHRLAALGMFTDHQAMIYRRAVIGPRRFDERYPVGADYAFTLQAIAGARRIERLPFPVCVFGPAGLSARNARAGRADQTRIRRELLGHGRGLTTTLTVLQYGVQNLRACFPTTYALLRGRFPERSFRSFHISLRGSTKP